MTEQASVTPENPAPDAKKKRTIWNHTTPVSFPPMFSWPPRLMDIVDGLVRRWVTLTRNLLFLLLAWWVFAMFTPDEAVNDVH